MYLLIFHRTLWIWNNNVTPMAESIFLERTSLSVTPICLVFEFTNLWKNCSSHILSQDIEELLEVI